MIIEISTLEQWNTFADSVTNGNDYAGKTVKLTADIGFEGRGVSHIYYICDGCKLINEPFLSNVIAHGWYKDRELQNEWDFEKDYVTNDMTLCAKWVTKEEIYSESSEHHTLNKSSETIS